MTQSALGACSRRAHGPRGGLRPLSDADAACPASGVPLAATVAAPVPAHKGYLTRCSQPPFHPQVRLRSLSARVRAEARGRVPAVAAAPRSGGATLRDGRASGYSQSILVAARALGPWQLAGAAERHRPPRVPMHHNDSRKALSRGPASRNAPGQATPRDQAETPPGAVGTCRGAAAATCGGGVHAASERYAAAPAAGVGYPAREGLPGEGYPGKFTCPGTSAGRRRGHRLALCPMRWMPPAGRPGGRIPRAAGRQAHTCHAPVVRPAGSKPPVERGR